MRAFLTICVLLAPLCAHAEDVQAAKQHFDRGQMLYDLQRYLDSAHEYELAYEAKPDPAFLYDIGQAYRLAGEPAKALGAYRAFRRHSPAEAARVGIDGRIADMERLVMMRPTPPPPAPPPTAETKPAPVAAPPAAVVTAPPPAPVSPRAGRSKTIAGAVVTGVGGALVVSGIALTVVGHDAYDRLQNPPAGYVYEPATQDAMRTGFPAGLALIGVGAAAVVAGAVVLAIGARERRPVRLALHR